MSLAINKIVFIYDDVFKVRIDSTLRKLGIIDITCHSNIMNKGLRGDEVGITIDYSDDLDYLPDAVEEEVRFQLVLMSQISSPSQLTLVKTWN
jgi:hypothetical protein